MQHILTGRAPFPLSFVGFVGLLPRGRHKYCVEATSENGAAGNTYKSQPNCDEVQVHWESLLIGKVISKGTMAQGVGGVEVKWQLKTTKLGGTVRTNAAGRFEIHVKDLDDEILAQFEAGKRDQTATVDIDIVVSKGTDTFTCEDMIKTCGGKDVITGHVFPEAKYTLVAEYLKFQYDELDVKRIQHAPIVPFDGQVAFPLTHHVFPAGDGESTLDSSLPSPFGADSKCYIKKAEVCTYDFDFNNMPIHCTETDMAGKYHIPVAVHTRVRVEVTWKSHVFELARDSIEDFLVSDELFNKKSVPIVSVVTSESATRHVDFVDVSGQIVTLGAHATQCGFAIGTEALFKISVKPLAYVCHPSSEMMVVVPTSVITHTRVMLPGHDIQVTLDAVEPGWPQVTDASDIGYFSRVKNRTRDLNLVAVSETRLGGQDPTGGGGGNAEPVERYEYHPQARLEIEVRTEDARAAQPAAACDGTVKVRDVPSDEEMTLTPGDAPTWIVDTGAQVNVGVSVFEDVPYPHNSATPQTCDWVEMQQDDLYPAVVKHVNELGLSTEELAGFENDDSSAEYKVAATVYAKTLGDEYPATADMVDSRLSKCNQAKAAGDTACALHVERDDDAEYSDSFGSDHRCAVTSPGAPVAVGFSPVRTESSPTEEDFSSVCAKALDVVTQQRGLNDGGTKYRSWHKLADWKVDLTLEERGYAQSLTPRWCAMRVGNNSVCVVAATNAGIEPNSQLMK